MRYTIDHDYHIHTYLSSCSRDKEQTAERILRYARENRLKRVAVTDHYWDSSVDRASPWYKPQDFAHISKILPLPEDSEVEFLFGCEAEMDRHGRLGIPKARYGDFDLVIIPTTHLHMKGFTVDECDYERSEAISRVYLERLRLLLDMPLPKGRCGIAHPVCPLMIKHSREDYLRTLDGISSSGLEEVFSIVAERGIGVEINQDDMSFSDREADTVLRPFKIARSVGCKFYLGSDAHHPSELNTAKEVFERAINMLGLTEYDKFIPEAK